MVRVSSFSASFGPLALEGRGDFEACIVHCVHELGLEICDIRSMLLSADTALEFSLPGPSFVCVGGPDADSSAVYWNVGSCRCQNTGQESPSCLSAHTWTALLGLSQLIVAVKSLA